jgi:ABC-type Mn2+/Zn2+ transport system ATPase subunit
MSTDAVVEVRNLSVSYHAHRALNCVSFSVTPGQLVGIIGPNGAGKSTLVKAIVGLINVDQGEINIWQQPVAKVRKRIAYVPQRNDIDLDFPVRVQDIVMMGRFPYLGLFGRPNSKDRTIVANCLQQVGMYEFRNRQIRELSGGQQQRVFLARALAQEADLFFLDEPFSGIDLNSESIIINILKKLRDQNKTTFIVFHDLAKAIGYFDSLILLNKKLVAFGSGKTVLNAKRLSEAYQGSIAILSSTNELMMVNA